MYSLISLFTTLVQIDSVSGTEQQLAEWIIQYLSDLDLQPEQDTHGMIYCRIGSEPDPKLFVGHMDTVSPGVGIEVVEQEGYLRSKGETILGGDNKVTIAAILYTVGESIKAGRSLNCELLFTVQEETVGGIQQFDTTRLESRHAYVFDHGTTDGDLGTIVQSAPTLYDLTIELYGKSCHAARPAGGRNVLTGLLSLHDLLLLGQYDDKTTLNLGLISGGSAANAVPDYLKLVGDLRSSDHAHAQQVRDHLTTQITKRIHAFGLEAAVNFLSFSQAYQHDLEHDPEYGRLQSIYRRFNLDLKPVQSYSGSDASFLNYSGVTAYCLGYGVTGAHTTKEQISIKTFATLQKVVAAVMEE